MKERLGWEFKQLIEVSLLDDQKLFGDRDSLKKPSVATVKCKAVLFGREYMSIVIL